MWRAERDDVTGWYLTNPYFADHEDEMDAAAAILNLTAPSEIKACPITFEVDGDDYDSIWRNAGEVVKSYYGEHRISVLSVDHAEPVRTINGKPYMWRGYCSAYLPLNQINPKEA